ncbi:MAG: hypothetical protein ABFR97_11385 [Thermodesulfobacteriota bacterium]
MKPATCVKPDGTFAFSLHKPSYPVHNLRPGKATSPLGAGPQGTVTNEKNFPAGDLLDVAGADPVYEIRNPLPFKGATFISASWAAARAKEPGSIHLEKPEPVSFHAEMAEGDQAKARALLGRMPQPLLIALATSSTDANDLMALAQMACQLIEEEKGEVTGLCYDDRQKPMVTNHDLYEAVANNPFLPNDYKQAMVLRPGAQGGSEIIGDYQEGESHVFEYLRRNSYIPWGHFAANLANDTVRYTLGELREAEMRGLRHLYYQRSYQRLAEELHLPGLPGHRQASPIELEDLRREIMAAMAAGSKPTSKATLWGWNYGFDLAASNYRLNASHQMIHQQYAMIPAEIEGEACFACGDLIAQFCGQYQASHNKEFFPTYLAAIAGNSRMDGGRGPTSLIIYEDEQVISFVPKAQTSQWEVQIMTKGAVGNILEAELSCRASLDRAFFLTTQALHGLGLRLMTTIEYSKSFTDPGHDQRLLYTLLPRLPWAPGAFSESQQRWIMGHFPEDFAQAVRDKLP